jgi:hypothetical protein
LASIETKEELEMVLVTVGRVTRGRWLWVGAKRVSGTKEFEWLSGARLKEDDEAWVSGEPEGGWSDCVLMLGGGSKTDAYGDYPCTWTRPPLCEMPGLYFLTISISFDISPVDNRLQEVEMGFAIFMPRVKGVSVFQRGEVAGH